MARTLKSYCPLAFKEIYMDSAGSYRLCCHSSSQNNLQKFNNSNSTPFDFFHSTEMEKIRNDMLNNKPIKGCEVCYNMENNNNKSYRQLRYIPKYDYPTDIDKVSLKLRIFGSYCNLSCYMCIPYNSTTRRKELNDIYGDEYKKIDGFNREVKIIKSDHWKKYLNNLLDNIDLIDHIHFTGGEPLQLPRHWEFVKSIPKEKAKNIKLTYDTNLTKLTWKENSIFHLQTKFKNVELEVSCDHYGDKLKWIRYPINVKEFENNLKIAKHIIKKISVTVSILNIMDLQEIIDYYSKLDMQVDITNVVRFPSILSIKNIPNKEHYIEKFSHISILNEELSKTKNDNEYQQGLDYCQKLSDHRGFNYKELWPNL